MYMLKVENQGQVWYMKGTTWTSDKARATCYESGDKAIEAMAKVKKFMKAGLYKKIELISE